MTYRINYNHDEFQMKFESCRQRSPFKHGASLTTFQIILSFFIFFAAVPAKAEKITQARSDQNMAAPVRQTPIRIVAFGDSLTAGFGLPAAAAFPAVLEERLRADGLSVQIENAGVSGETTSGGLARLDWSIQEDAEVVILELGANDMLRNISPALTKTALKTMIERLQAKKIFVVLAGIQSTANWGAAYQQTFDAIYPDLAKQFNIPLYPNFLEGVINDKTRTLPDGLHPNAQGVKEMVERFAPFLEPLLRARFGEAAKAKNKPQ